MTSQKDQIQSLIADIEQALGSERPQKPWIRASETEPQRQMLARAQAYLKSLQQAFDAPGGWGPVDPSTGQVSTGQESTGQGAGAPADRTAIEGIFSGALANSQANSQVNSLDSSAEDVLQALLTEMKFLRSSALEPLRLEMDSLRVQRDRLQQEVVSLSEEQTALSLSQSRLASTERSSVSEEQLNQFLAALMDRLQERLSSQVTQTLSQLESDHAEAVAKLSAASETEVLELRPSGQMEAQIDGQLRSSAQIEEEMRQIQSRSDQLLVNIESTLQGMFETLQRNIDSYQVSLNEGIENMHSLGRQGEVIVRSLVDHLTQQLGQTATPEPAFFPPRTAELPPAPDTVASLDDILPEAVSETIAETAVEAQKREAQPEDCIQADGTIDLDLLKLDIDRDDETDELTADELMIDAAIADAKVAATEADDPAIEAKVMPTADAIYLADLTLDDLILDDLTLNERDEPIDEARSRFQGTPALDAQFAHNAQLAYDAELAALLPDLSEPADYSTDANEPIQEFIDQPAEVENLEPYANSEAADSEAADSEDDSAEDDSAESMAAVLAAATLSAAVASRSTDVSPDESALIKEEPDSLLESAIVPDVPDADDDEADTENLQDDEISGELAAALEADNRDAERAARDSASSGLAALASDLEEAIVFEADAPLPGLLTDKSQPLESALIPDFPESPREGRAEKLIEGLLEERPEASTEASTEASAETVEANHELEPVARSLVENPEDTFEVSFLELEGELEEISLASDGVSAAPSELTDAQEPEQANWLDQSAALSDEDVWADAPADLIDAPVADDLSVESPLDFDDDLDFYSEEAVSADAVDELARVPEPAAEAPLADLPVADAPVGFPELPAIPVEGFAIPLEGFAIAPPLPTAVAASISAAAAATVAAPGSELQSALQSELTLQADTDEGDDAPSDGQPVAWFLGLDIGTTGISAVLINQLGDQVYPLCWNIPGDNQANRFRLPAVLQMDGPADFAGAVGPTALQQSQQLLRNLKPLLKVGVPRSTGEPWIQWSDGQMLPLLSIQAALTNLLRTLSVPASTQMSCQAVGLKHRALRQALTDLKGVIVGYPNNWPDTYSFNVREALLAAGLVKAPEQVFFVEEAIAALLSALPDPKVAHEDLDNQQPGLYNCNWAGGTVVISAGATLSEAAIADLPKELDQLIYRDFALRSFTYAGDSLDQDIICQLLHIPAQARLEANAPTDNDAAGWQSLGLTQLNLPQAGEADRLKRHRLRQRLNDSPLGHEAVAAAQRLKLTLQEETQCELTLADQTWVVKRKDLETKVFLPYIQRVNRQINSLLSQKGLSAQAVKQVVCTGGSASLGAIARWLRQKFPNATIIQDTYSGEYSNSCSRVAYGLANLCHYPHVLDTHRHQYNDYFLLLELLRILPDQPLPAGGILHLLEQRGINTQACQSHILALIEGHLPPGLVPTEGDRPMISAQSPDIGTYQILAELPLFRKQGGQIYIADPQQGERLRNHLEALLATKAQTLQEPLTADLTAVRS